MLADQSIDSTSAPCTRPSRSWVKAWLASFNGCVFTVVRTGICGASARPSGHEDQALINSHPLADSRATARDSHQAH